jgi:hypothetical protein
MDKNELEAAAVAGLLQSEQVEPLHEFLAGLHHDRPRFDLTHVLYYSGGLVAIGAMTLFMNLGWQRFGGWGTLSISLCYALAGLWLTQRFFVRRHSVPAAVSGAFVISMVPLVVFAAQEVLGVWPAGFAYPEFHRRIAFAYIYMELATMLVAAFMLYGYRLPFFTMPLGVSLWYLSMDFAELILGVGLNVSQMGYLSMAVGGLMLVLSMYVDLRSPWQIDYAFWLYLFAVATFWGGLSVQSSDSEWAHFGYFAVNLMLIGFGVLLGRRVFVVFGALGAGSYLVHLASEVFLDSWLFPVVLCALGLCIVYLGVWWQKNEAWLSGRLRGCLPPDAQDILHKRLV